jgi:hypothetical protein
MTRRKFEKPEHGRRFHISLRMLMGLVLIAGVIVGWVEHRIRLKAAERAHKRAQLTTQVAEIAVVEYVHGIYQQEINTVDAEIASAKAHVNQADNSLGQSNRIVAVAVAVNGPAANLVSEEESVLRAMRALAQAQEKRRTLQEKTKGQTISELKSELKKAKLDELIKSAAYEKAKATWMGVSW